MFFILISPCYLFAPTERWYCAKEWGRVKESFTVAWFIFFPTILMDGCLADMGWILDVLSLSSLCRIQLFIWVHDAGEGKLTDFFQLLELFFHILGGVFSLPREGFVPYSFFWCPCRKRSEALRALFGLYRNPMLQLALIGELLSSLHSKVA